MRYCHSFPKGPRSEWNGELARAKLQYLATITTSPNISPYDFSSCPEGVRNLIKEFGQGSTEKEKKRSVTLMAL